MTSVPLEHTEGDPVPDVMEGVTVTDSFDTTVVVTSEGAVDTSVPATYTVTYSATDASGNNVTATREYVVLAKNKVPPTLEVVPAVVTLTEGDPAPDLLEGVTASDDVDGVITPTIAGSVDTSVVGEQTVTYTATDSAGNTVSVSRTPTRMRRAASISKISPWW